MNIKVVIKIMGVTIFCDLYWVFKLFNQLLWYAVKIFVWVINCNRCKEIIKKYSQCMIKLLQNSVK